MLIELPIQLINKKESDIVGSENAEVMSGMLTIRIDCIQAIHRDIPTRSILETKTGSTYLILIPYETMKGIWHRALDTMHGTFIITNDSKDSGSKVIPKTLVCENCGGVNLDDSGEQNSPEGPIIIKKCRDCGVIQSFK